MRLAYVDAFSGASGDMMLGALIDAGVSTAALTEALEALELPGWCLDVRRESRGAITGTRAEVREMGSPPLRRFRDIHHLISTSSLPDTIRETALRIFDRLARAEARVHGMALEEVHFHEIGAVDTVVDVVGVVVGLDLLGVQRLYASPLPLGRGRIMSSHGMLPVPAPATVALLEGVPVRDGGVDRELVTPTGAAILTGLCEGFGPLPDMVLSAVGYGVGAHPADNPPNVLRLMVGEPQAVFARRRLLMMETQIDDMNPEFYEHLMASCFAEGALDVVLVPVYMKKNRPGTLVRILLDPSLKDRMAARVFCESSTLGVRFYEVDRVELPRAFMDVDTPWGVIRVKTAALPDGSVRCQPEYEPCREAALRSGLPLPQIYEEVRRRSQEKAAKKSGESSR
ncbi:MAG: nickel pincer cofactor biosynthesis protein LarC [Desulfosoma sp.]|uniref:nickel pincer cofactor biosynthesis protein LarC n=1 Tax=Desulfosoma sp. TaxID=2603217 RepID=UPI00404AE6FB